MRIKRKLYFLAFYIIIIFMAYTAWKYITQDRYFECRAHVHSNIKKDYCNANSEFDFFIAMHGNGKGHILISGTYLCPKVTQKIVDDTAGFTYKKEGGYYFIHMDKVEPSLKSIFNILSYDEIILKITKISNRNYFFSLPNEPLFFCTKD